MFKKLKDKIAEEVKSSPQRIVELAQTVQNSYATSNNGVSSSKQKPSNSNQFSITEEETPQNSPDKSGFTNVSLVDTNVKTRRDSNSSIASDVSLFLPKYESANNLYHLQSDLDISASEVEDNLQYSSQLENISKENLYKAYNTMKAKYSKYRGRYSDLARHYRDLEREHTRTKSVLVETQDKTLRRVSELKEQCSLEQTAKAHLEQELRIDLDEKQLTINALKQKVGLLQKATGQPVNVSTNFDLKGDDIASDLINNDVLLEDLKRAKCEIEYLQKQLNEQNISKSEHCSFCITNKSDNESQKLIDLDTSATSEKNSVECVNVLPNLNIELLNQKLIEKDEKLKEKQMQINQLMEKCKNSESLEQELLILIDENFNLKLQIEKCKQIENENERHLLETENYVRKLTDYEEKNKILLDKTFQLEKDIESKENKIKTLNDKILNHAESVKTKDELRQEIDNQIKHFESKEQVFIESNESLKKELDAAHIEISNLRIENKKNIELFKQQLQTTEQKLNDFEWTSDKGNQELCDLKGILQNKESEILELNAAKCKIVQVNEELNEELDNWKQQVNSLTLEKSELETYIIDIENKKKDCENKIFELMVIVENYKAETEQFSKQIHDMRVTNNELLRKVSDLEKEQNICQNKITDLTVELSSLNNEKQGLQTEISAIESMSLFKNSENTQVNYLIDDINETIKVLATEKHNYEKQISSLMSENNAYSNKVHKLNTKCGELTKHIESLKAELEKTNSELSNSKQIISEMESHNLELLNKEKELLKNEIDDLNKENFIFSQEIEVLKLQNNNLQVENSDLKIENENLLSNNNYFKADLEKNISENTHNTLQITKITNELQMLKTELIDKQNEIKTLVSQLDNDQNEKMKLQLQLKEQQENNNQFIEKIRILTTELDEKHSKLSILKEENSDLLQKIDCLFLEKSEQASELLELKLKNVKMNEELNELSESNNKVNDLESELKIKENHLISTENKISELMKSNDEKDVNLINLAKRLTELEEQNEKLKSIEMNNKEIKMKLKEKNNESIKLLDEVDFLKKNESADIKILKNRLLDLEKYIELKNKELESVDEQNFEIKTLKQEINDVHAELKLKDKEIDKLKEDVKNKVNIETEIQSVYELNTVFKNDMKDKDNQIELLKEKIISLENNNEINKNQISELTQQLIESRGEYDISKKRFNYYESEIEKLHNRNQKLTEKLDETLVTLNHTTQFESDGTEMEYLRNILYNYMTGKESLILAKVIAAVCKFSQEQTNIILQRETQKQTLLGQLGFV